SVQERKRLAQLSELTLGLPMHRDGKITPGGDIAVIIPPVKSRPWGTVKTHSQGACLVFIDAFCGINNQVVLVRIETAGDSKKRPGVKIAGAKKAFNRLF